ncbi:MAG TPA: cyclic lactone autoinducer peptide [Firmicutes bacterium]|nr:cyclic lactone autoinducer peptide [Bacillota bacterium]
MKKMLLGVITTLLTTLAVTSVAGACMWFWYQPPVPKSLE